MTIKLSHAAVLKFALFATGLSGIVAEYILSTLATYFLGNSVLQWTLILSAMLFTMGLGSRISRYFEHNLLEKFILIEFSLSLLVAFCTLIAYLTTAYVSFNYSLIKLPVRLDAAVIYTLALAIGCLIGMEIPLVMRINENYEPLKINVSNVMEKDYYGSLVGGIFFAFIGLPFLGLTYTPFILGSVNFLVACLLYGRLKSHLKSNRLLNLSMVFVIILLVGGVSKAQAVVDFGEQKRYVDKVIFQKQTPYQKIVLTQWKNDYWLYLNSNTQLSTLDEWLYHEPMVHPAMQLHPYPQNILILGGGDGCLAREILKYPTVRTITLVDLDPAMTDLGQNHPIFKKMNANALNHPKVKIINGDAFTFLERDKNLYDLIFADFPDPKTINISRLFSLEFYKLCRRQLRSQGLLVTQAGSPYYATKAFYCIVKTIRSAGFSTLPLHNQVLTLGEWGWVIGSKNLESAQLKERIGQISFKTVSTRWLTEQGLKSISSFGKPLADTTNLKFNTLHNPVLQTYYRQGNWSIY